MVGKPLLILHANLASQSVRFNFGVRRSLVSRSIRNRMRPGERKRDFRFGNPPRNNGSRDRTVRFGKSRIIANQRAAACPQCAGLLSVEDLTYAHVILQTCSISSWTTSNRSREHCCFECVRPSFCQSGRRRAKKSPPITNMKSTSVTAHAH